MITLFKQTPRPAALEYIRKKFPDHDLIRIDDMSDLSRIAGEIQSVDLFGKSRAIFLSDIPRDDWDAVIDSLEHVPEMTAVFWREDSFPVAYTKKIPKHEVIEGEKEKTIEKSNPFQIANQLSFANPTELWNTYRSLIEGGHAPEAVFGIIWWKLKDIAKSNKKLSPEFKKTLYNFLTTYSTARETGGEMETGLERLLLTITKKDLT